MMQKSFTMIGRASLWMVLAVAGVFASCTVKEARVPCPSYLNVSFADRDQVPEGAEVNLLGWNDAELFRACIDIADYDPYWVRGVHKQILLLSAYRGVEKVKDDGHYVLITPGNQADSLYAFHDEVDCTGDMGYSEVTFRKQFCTVHLDILRSASQMKDFRFMVEGNTCGFDLLSFEAVSGSFRCEPVAAGGARVVDFRIPRQVDDSMTVTLWMRTESGNYENLGTFPLGEYIVRTGYNWSAEELQDIYIVIDLVLGQITIQVEGWEHGKTFMYYEQ